MAKMYTLDNKLLTETPELRVGEKIYPVDNRQKTVAQLQQITSGFTGDNATERIAQALALALGPNNAAEIDSMNMPYPAYVQLFELLVAAMTGEAPRARFPAANE